MTAPSWTREEIARQIDAGIAEANAEFRRRGIDAVALPHGNLVISPPLPPPDGGA